MPSAFATDTVAPFNNASVPVNQSLLSEIGSFRKDCFRRYHFNNRWDVVLTTLGILLSVAVVAAGFLKRPELSAILGAVVGAVVTAQKAFPFGQRASFYRLLIGQTDNLSTRVAQRLWNTEQAVDFLATLRLDFAQELPRGTSTHDNGNPASTAATPPCSDTTTPQPATPGEDPSTATAGAGLPATDLPTAPTSDLPVATP